MADENNQDAASQGIVSVNSRGGTGSNNGPKIAFFFLVIAAVVIAALVGINSWRDSMAEDVAEDMAKKNQNQPAVVANRRHFSTDPPVIDKPEPKPQMVQPAVNIEGLCSDGSRGNPIRDSRGRPLPGVDGDVARVCPSGRIIVAVAAPAPEPIKVQPATAPKEQGPSRYNGSVLVKSASSPMGGAGMAGGNNPTARAARNLQQISQALGMNGNRAGGGQTSLLGGDAGMMTGAGRSGGGGGSDADTTGPLGNLLQGADTHKVQATMLGNRSMILPKGRVIPCSLSTRVINEVSGMATCVITQNVYSDNGRVVLIERGSEAVGEYKADMHLGQRRLFLLWTRVKTPEGVIIKLESPSADGLGTSGLPGYVDNRWGDRIGAAFLLSLVNDGINYQTAKAQEGTTGQTNFNLAETTETGNDIAEQVLEKTINIKPTLYANQGDRVSIFVARDLDFGEVYALRTR